MDLLEPPENAREIKTKAMQRGMQCQQDVMTRETYQTKYELHRPLNI